MESPSSSSRSSPPTSSDPLRFKLEQLDCLPNTLLLWDEKERLPRGERAGDIAEMDCCVTALSSSGMYFALGKGVGFGFGSY